MFSNDVKLMNFLLASSTVLRDVFLMRWDYLKEDSKNILKQFLHFLIHNFWDKVDGNYKSLEK